MKCERINLYEPEEYHYRHAFGFMPNLHTYLHEDSRSLPLVLVVPGGGYNYCSESESEITARTFYRLGYQAAVLTYTCNLLFAEPLKEQPLRDIVRAVRLLRTNAEEFGIDPKRIIVCGFSAGGHLSGTLAEYHDSIDDVRYPSVSAAPDRLILCYPVITSGEYGHHQSFEALLGKEASEEETDRMSLEKHVREDMCPVFLWQTAEDQAVPVENSYLMALALRKKRIPFEHHVFPHGRHGLCVATEEWQKRTFAAAYSLEQVKEVLAAVDRGEITADRDAVNGIRESYANRIDPDFVDRKKKANKEVAVWVDLADAWLKRSFAESE